MTRFRQALSFTLIELLVVVAIVSMLAALTAPALNQARAMAKKSKCQSNLHQIGIGLEMYCNDHDQLLPWALTWSWNDADAGMPGAPVYFHDVMIPYLGGTNFNASPVFRDPGVKDAWVKTLDYHYNYNFWYCDGRDTGNSPRSRESAKEPGRAMTVKCAGFHDWLPNQWPHEGYNAVYVDGHVGFIKGEDYNTSNYTNIDAAGW